MFLIAGRLELQSSFISGSGDRMGPRDTLKTYNPVTLVVGCGFVACGLWVVAEVLLDGVSTNWWRTAAGAAGGIVMLLLCIVVPISLGAAIIHNQLRLRRNLK